MISTFIEMPFSGATPHIMVRGSVGPTWRRLEQSETHQCSKQRHMQRFVRTKLHRKPPDRQISRVVLVYLKQQTHCSSCISIAVTKRFVPKLHSRILLRPGVMAKGLKHLTMAPPKEEGKGHDDAYGIAVENYQSDGVSNANS